MLLLLIIGFVEAASGALVYIAATAVIYFASRMSLKLQLRIGFFPATRAAAASDTAYLATLARLFVHGSVWRLPLLILSSSSLDRRRLCVVAIPAFAGRPLKSGPKNEAYRGPSVFPILPNPCRSGLAWVSPNLSSTTLAIFLSAVTPAAVMSLSTPPAVFSGHLRLTCVELYNIFWWLDKIYYKFLHLGSSEVSWLIDRRVEVGQRALLRRLNSNRCCKSFL